ncbi:MAG: hypothetical protein WAV09_01305 [Minisyncoccia bacterium]
MSLEKFFTQNPPKERPTEENSELPPTNTLPFLSQERREDILEIVDYTALCIENYFKGFDIPPLPTHRFFLFTQESNPVSNKDALGLYLPRYHAYGVRDDMVYAPHILIHEMVHYLAAEKTSHTKNTGFQFVGTQERDGESVAKVFYVALNEGVTDLIAQEIYSLYYKDLKLFFVGRGGMDARPSGYSRPIEFIQKLIEYNALIKERELEVSGEKTSAESAHRQVWEELKKAYLANDQAYLEKLFLVFVNSPEEKQETVAFMESLTPKKEHAEGFDVLITALDKKIKKLKDIGKPLDTHVVQ